MQTVKVKTDTVNNTAIAEEFSSSSFSKIKEKVSRIASKIFDYIKASIPIYSLFHNYKKNKDTKDKEKSIEEQYNTIRGRDGVIETQGNEIKKQEERIEGLGRYIEVLKNQIKERDGVIETQGNKIKKQEERIAGLGRHSEVLDNNIEFLEEMTEQLEGKVEHLQGKNEELREQNKKLASEVTDLFSKFLKQYKENEVANREKRRSS